MAAAMIGGADVIVTENARDFPESRVPEGLRIVSPRAFAIHTVEVDPVRAVRAVRAIATRSQCPPRTCAEIVATLESRYMMTEVAAVLRACL